MNLLLLITILSSPLIIQGRWIPKSHPEIFMTVNEILTLRGYKNENHQLITKDGYILTLQRVLPNKKVFEKKRVALLQHGLLDSAHTWINNPNDQSLAFILSDAGYDVWMANSRGSTYSMKHIFLNPNKNQYWDFTWDEMAKYDLPNVIDYVLKQTNVDSVYYVGHSQGTEMFFAHMNDNPENQNKIKAYGALAPVAYLSHVQSPIRYIAPFCQSIESVVSWFGHGEFLPSSELLKILSYTLCGEHEIQAVCSNVIYLLAGYDKANTNTTRLPVYLGHTPAGTSSQNLVHYCQSLKSGLFQKYDFGYKENMRRYGQGKPPTYGLQNLKVPTAVYWGGEDWLASPQDVKKLIEELGDTIKENIFLDNYNHLDFVWGMDANRKVYDPLLKFFEKY